MRPQGDGFAQPRFLDAAIGHVVHAKAGHVVDDDPADLQLVECVKGVADVLGEHTRGVGALATLQPLIDFKGSLPQAQRMKA